MSFAISCLISTDILKSGGGVESPSDSLRIPASEYGSSLSDSTVGIVSHICFDKRLIIAAFMGPSYFPLSSPEIGTVSVAVRFFSVAIRAPTKLAYPSPDNIRTASLCVIRSRGTSSETANDNTNILTNKISRCRLRVVVMESSTLGDCDPGRALWSMVVGCCSHFGGACPSTARLMLVCEDFAMWSGDPSYVWGRRSDASVLRNGSWILSVDNACRSIDQRFRSERGISLG